MFGILYPKQKRFGTTADLRGFREHSSDDGQWTLTVKAEGSQRFEIVEKKVISRVIFMAEVRILPDIRLLPPGQRLMTERSRLRNTMGSVTPVPAFVFDQSSEKALMQDISQGFQAILGKVCIASIAATY